MSTLPQKKSGVHALEITCELAQDFWDASLWASPFCNPTLLKEAATSVRYFAAFKGSEILSVWPIPIGENGSPTTIPFFSYVGPYWKDDWVQLAEFRKFTTGVAAQNALLEVVAREFASFYFELAPGYQDIRGFLWKDFRDEHEPSITIIPRYTAVIENLGLKSDMDLVNQFRSDDKRKRIRKLLDSPLPLTLDFHATEKDVLSLYSETIERNLGTVSKNVQDTLGLIFRFARGGGGAVIILSEKEGGLCVGFQILLSGKGRIVTHAVAQGVSHDWREKGAASLLTYQSILFARDSGSSQFDFDGANSPKRADDKHSFGADAKLYIGVTIRPRG